MKALVNKAFETALPAGRESADERDQRIRDAAALEQSGSRAGIPADFIPIAEGTALIIPLDGWLLKAACYQAVDWPDNIKVAVNLSPAKLNNRNLLSVVTGALSQTDMPPHKLQFEITATVLLEHVCHACDAARAA